MIRANIKILFTTINFCTSRNTWFIIQEPTVIILSSTSSILIYATGLMRLITVVIEAACMIDKYEFIKSMDEDTKDNPINDE